MFKVFSGISYITTLFALIFSLISNYGDETNIYAWIAFASQLFNAILFTTLDMLKTKVEQQREDIKWLDGELSKVKSQLADIKKNTK